MHAALFLLLRLRFRGMVRRLGKGLQKPSGILLAIFGGGLLVLWLGPMLLGMVVGPRYDIEPVIRYGPAAIAVLLLANLLGRAARATGQFTQADVDLLFPAPLRRSQLLLYKSAEMFAAALAIALFFSIMLMRVEAPWIILYLALVVTLQFVNLASMAYELASRRFGGLRPRLVVLGGLILIGLVAAGQIELDAEAGLWANVNAVLDAPVVRAVLTPLLPFVGILAAQSIVGFALNLILSLALMAAVFWVIVRLDALTIDATVARSQEFQKQLQRARSQAGIPVRVSARSARLRIGQLPWLGGAGPILWKQLTTAVRSMTSVLFPIIVIAGVYSAIIFLVPAHEDLNIATMVSIMIVAMAGFTLPQMLMFDFRRELDQMDWLKRLPIRPLPLATGQILTPALMTTALQWVLLIVGVGLGALSPGIAWALAVLVAPFNLLNTAIENAAFLTFPTRQLAVGIADFVAFSRMMLLFMLRSFILFACTGGAVLLGWIASRVAGGSWAAFTVVTAIVLSAMAIASLPVVAAAFVRFDVSRDLPA